MTTRFDNCYTRGFAAVGEPNVAVCLLLGTEVVFKKEIEHERSISLFPSVRLEHKVARFRQVNKDNPNTHHDALELPDGKVILLTHLREGQHATVLQLPATPRIVSEAEKQKLDSLGG